MPRLNPSFLNQPRLIDDKDLRGLALASAAWAKCAGEAEPEKGAEAKDVLGRDIEPEAACSSGEGMGISTVPPSSSRRTCFLPPFPHFSFERENRNLEVAALSLLWQLAEPRQGHSGKGL